MSRRRPTPIGPKVEREDDGETKAPWPYLTQKQAAKRLGVGFDFISGLANQTHSEGVTLRAVRADGRSQQVLLFNREDVLALREKMLP